MPRKSWWARLPFGVRMAAGATALVLVIGAGVGGFVFMTGHDAQPSVVTAVGDAATPGTAASEGNATELPSVGSAAVPARTSNDGDPAAGRNPAGVPGPIDPRSAAKAKAQPSPLDAGGAGAGSGTASGNDTQTTGPAARSVITTRTETETREVPFATRTVPDPGLPAGSKEVQTPGVAGEATLRYLVTLTDGKQTDRRLLDSTVTRAPQQQVVAVGSRSDRCGGPLDLCVPIGRDATCGGRWRDENGEATDAGQVNLDGNDLAILGGGHGDSGGWGGHDGGRGC